MRVSVHACTHRSAMHADNEDRVVVGTEVLSDAPDVAHTELFAPTVVGVFDGLGGHPAGDVASQLAAELVAEAGAPGDPEEAGTLLQRADEALHDAARADPEHLGMGSTAALLGLDRDGRQAVVANVGDSSVLMLANGELAELTVSDRAFGGALRQCLGASDEVAILPHVSSIEVAPGDRFLLATDGLTDVAPASAIEAALRDGGEQAAARLLAMVDDAGSPDDVAIVLVEILED